MAYCRLLWSLLFLMDLLSVTKSSVIPNNSAVRRPNTDSKCPVYNTYYNSHFNTGLIDKKVEALLHRVLKELSEMRDEIRSSKGNKTAGKYPKYTALKSANNPKNSIPTISKRPEKFFHLLGLILLHSISTKKALKCAIQQIFIIQTSESCSSEYRRKEKVTFYFWSQETALTFVSDSGGLTFQWSL